MRTRRSTGSTKGMRPILVGVLLAAVTAAPLVGSSFAGAVSGRTEATAHESLTAHATLHCGSVTFIFSPTNPVTYFQLNAVGVSCAEAKHVLVTAGHYDPKVPAGWSYWGSGTHGASDCWIGWKHGAERVIAYRSNSGGC
jgi:hypothetical protein